MGWQWPKASSEQSGGSLSIESAVGKGTQITLWLPVAVDEAAAIVAPAQAIPAERFGVSDLPCVVLVDDDAIVRNVLTLSLEDAGYNVRAVNGGAAALTWLEADERADVLVSDLTMPGMDGLMLIRAAQELRPNLPAVLLTGYAGDGAALAVGAAITGPFALLRKPVSGIQLIDRINALLVSRRQSNSA